MIFMFQLLTFLRVLVVLLSGETSLRYALWWYETRKVPNALLISLMLGIAAVHGALAMLVGISVLSPFGFDPSPANTWVFIVFSVGVVGGTFYHLIPCWRISCGLSTRWVAFNLALRVVMALGLVYLFSAVWKV